MSRYVFLHLAALLTICTTSAWPESPSQYRVTLSGRLRPWDVHRAAVPVVHILFDGSATPQECLLNRDVRPDGLFTCSDLFTQQVSPRIARIEVTLPGFKRYSRNIPGLEFRSAGAGPLLKAQRYTSSVDLGIIDLTTSQLPQVAQVILSTGADGARRFDITLRNSLKNEVLLKEVTLEASRLGTAEHCCCPPMAIFAVSSALVINTAGSVTGSFEERLHSKDYRIEAKGEIDFDPCNHMRLLSLTLPTEVSLPGDQFTIIQILMPARMRIDKATFVNGKTSEVPNAKLVDNGELDHFTSFTFSIRTSADDEAMIVAHYSSK